MDEDKMDPFPAKTTLELEEMVEACYVTKEVLGREDLIYSKDADFSNYTDPELNAMNAFVRENSRMLSVILAGGPQHFWNGQGLSSVQQLKQMEKYIDDKVKDFLKLDKIIETLDIKTKYGRTAVTSKSATLTAHPEMLSFTFIDANRAPNSEESLQRLATVCEQFAKQCRSISQMRASKTSDRSKKAGVKQLLEEEVETVLPMLRQHVLKIGLGKTNFQESAGVDSGKSSHKLTSLFTHAAVQDAHRAVEDSRERLMQELLFRRAKVERRLKREEDLADSLVQEREGSEARRQFGGLNGIPAYQGVIKSSGENSGRGGGKGDNRVDAVKSDELSSSRRSVTLSPKGTFSPDNAENAKTPNKGTSQRNMDSPGKPKENKGGSKAKAAARKASPVSPASAGKSPKARSKKQVA